MELADGMGGIVSIGPLRGCDFGHLLSLMLAHFGAVHQGLVLQLLNSVYSSYIWYLLL